jgi:signal recognition particle subunit SEC65
MYNNTKYHAIGSGWIGFSMSRQMSKETRRAPKELEIEAEVQTAVRKLTKTLQKTIQEHIPVSKPCPHLKQWWNSDLQVLKKKLNKLSREPMKKSTFRGIP